VLRPAGAISFFIFFYFEFEWPRAPTCPLSRTRQLKFSSLLFHAAYLPPLVFKVDEVSEDLAI
jgi:hypothetical protein